MDGKGGQQTPAPAGRAATHPSADLFVEKKNILDTSFANLENMFMARLARECSRDLPHHFRPLAPFFEESSLRLMWVACRYLIEGWLGLSGVFPDLS